MRPSGRAPAEQASDAHAHYRREIIKACWDEYAVTQICLRFGQRPTDGYEETFVTALGETRRANALIKAYPLHAILEKITAEVYGKRALLSGTRKAIAIKYAVRRL
ncbi:hypothetical protein [Bradyrhizobium retamae]|uniref:Uncharacterized protein n=2 Tax=Bradyrhizobium TaxID=374 RepID=A0A0R3MDC0_9BRAD|nr:hypothetical protein [Bradyrhizobium retamae]KRR15280.1 hypothetical protein CQ13_37315 [Bradyrhizobium retamae]